MNKSTRRVPSHGKVTSRNAGCLAVKGESSSSCARLTKLSTTTDLNKFRCVEPSLVDKVQCQGIDAAYWIDDEFPSSDGMAPAAEDEDDADHRASIFSSKGIEPHSIAKETTLNNYPSLSCNPSVEGFEEVHPNVEKAHTMMMPHRSVSVDAMHTLKSRGLRRKKSIHRALRMGGARIRRTRDIPVKDSAVLDSSWNLLCYEDMDQEGNIETSMNELGRFEPSIKKDLCQGDAGSHSDEGRCLMDHPTVVDQFPPSTKMATATSGDDDGDRRVSIVGSKVTPGIETQLFDQDIVSNNHPALGCGSSFEGYEAMHPSGGKTLTMTSEQKSLEAMPTLKSQAPRKKKSIHRAVKVGVAMIRRTRDRPVNGIAVGDRVSNLQPLEDKDQAKDLKDLGQFEPFSTLELDQCHGDEDVCLMDNPTDSDEFLPSTEMTTATTEDDDGDRCASIVGSNATPGIEPQSVDQDMASNNHPDVHFSSSLEGFEASHSSVETTYPMTTPLRSLEAMQTLKSSALRKKKSIHSAVRVEMAKRHHNSVGNRVSILQPLEDKDRAGTATIMNDLGQLKTQSSLDKEEFQCNCSTDSPTSVDRFPSFVAIAAATSVEEDDTHLVSVMADQNYSPLLGNDLCQGIDDRCSMDSPMGDDRLSSSAGMAAATDKDHVGVHLVSTPMDVNDLGQFEQPSLEEDQCVVNELVDVRSRSTISVESTGKSLAKVPGSKMTKVEETQPLSIMTNTKKGQAKIIHEVMPATGREGFKLVMEEKGYEIIECDLLPGREEGPLDVNTPPPNNYPAFCYGSSLEEFEVIHPPLQKSHPMTPVRSLEGNQTLESYATTFDRVDENSVNQKFPSSLLQHKAHSCNYGHKLESTYTKPSAISWYPFGSPLHTESIDGPVERSAGIYNVSSVDNSSMESLFLESFEVDSTVLPDDTSFGCVHRRPLFGGDFSNFHDVVDRIEDAITGCMGDKYRLDVSSFNLSDEESGFSDEEDNVEVRLGSCRHKKRMGQKNSQMYGGSGGRNRRASYKVNFSPGTIPSEELMVKEDSFDNVLHLPI